MSQQQYDSIRKTMEKCGYSIVFLVMATLLACPAVGQGDGTAAAITHSKDRISGVLTIPKEHVGTDEDIKFLFRVQDRGMVRVTNNATGDTRGFVIVRDDEESREGDSLAAVQEFKILQHPSGGGEAMEFVGVPIRIFPSVASNSTEEQYTIEITDVLLVDEPRVSTVDVYRTRPAPTPSACCVSCSGYTVCACAVSAPCGTCCSGSCCSGGGGPTTDTKY